MRRKPAGSLAWDFEPSDFELVSNFEFRISDFAILLGCEHRAALGPAEGRCPGFIDTPYDAMTRGRSMSSGDSH
jgi:hypothetical protein